MWTTIWCWRVDRFGCGDLTFNKAQCRNFLTVKPLLTDFLPLLQRFLGLLDAMPRSLKVNNRHLGNSGGISRVASHEKLFWLQLTCVGPGISCPWNVERVPVIRGKWSVESLTPPPIRGSQLFLEKISSHCHIADFIFTRNLNAWLLQKIKCASDW
jgi:hypothetical protein